MNELVTNAFKYTFPNDQPGAVDVEIPAQGRNLEIIVKDDGAGCPGDAKGGIGTRLINLLAAQMKGSMTRSPLPRAAR